MSSIFGKAILAAAIGLGAIATIPATASAREIIVVREGWRHHWNPGYREEYRRPHYGYSDYEYRPRPRHHHHHPRCFPNRWGEMVCVR
jgi:hypothetical protein